MAELIISLSSNVSERNVHLYGTVQGVVFFTPEGRITVAIDPPYAPAKYSVVDFFVEEKSRSKSVGKTLVDAMLLKYPKNIGAQCSSPASVSIFYNKGFRPPNDPEASIAEVMNTLRKDSSVYLKK